jgi:hypothetical protein
MKTKLRKNLLIKRPTLSMRIKKRRVRMNINMRKKANMMTSTMMKINQIIIDYIYSVINLIK